MKLPWFLWLIALTLFLFIELHLMRASGF